MEMVSQSYLLLLHLSLALQPRVVETDIVPGQGEGKGKEQGKEGKVCKIQWWDTQDS
jgi:hypothetical protein